jgi:catechol 2,3-dioxygenase-like lactoylglutathione lyase family enzyme
MVPSGVLETVLYAEDLEAVGSFYQETVGLKRVQVEKDRHVFFECGGQMLLIFNPHKTRKQQAGALPVPPHGAMGPGHVCFRASAEELDRWRTHFAARGIAIEADFEWPRGGRSIYIRDPAGNSVEFAESRIWGLS